MQAILKAAGVTNVTTLRRFADDEMDVVVLCMCSREDLVELGLDKKGQQLKLDKEIAKHLDLAHQTRIMDSDKLFRLLSTAHKKCKAIADNCVHCLRAGIASTSPIVGPCCNPNLSAAAGWRVRDSSQPKPPTDLHGP